MFAVHAEGVSMKPHRKLSANVFLSIRDTAQETFIVPSYCVLSL